MKFVRFGQRGQEKPGVIDAEGKIRDLSGVVADLTIESLAAAKGVDIASLPVVDGDPRYGVPVKGIGKIVAIGLNYEDHAIESNLPIPTEPMMFMKALSSLNGPNDEVMLPKGATHGDWEVELGVVIGETCRFVSEEDALSKVAGYVLVNDVSERFNQKQRGTQWSKGKGHDTFCPVGPWLVTKDEVPDPQTLPLWCSVDGQRYQDGTTTPMIFTVAHIIAYLSQMMTLEPGDVIATGTPPGVGMGIKPDPIFLKPGQIVECEVVGLGKQRHLTIAA